MSRTLLRSHLLAGGAAPDAAASLPASACVSTKLNSEDRTPAAYSLMRQRTASFVPAREVTEEQWCTEATRGLPVDCSLVVRRRRGGSMKMQLALLVLLVSLCAALAPGAAAQLLPYLHRQIDASRARHEPAQGRARQEIAIVDPTPALNDFAEQPPRCPAAEARRAEPEERRKTEI